jgi:Xaa-Pro aminopeptidase
VSVVALPSVVVPDAPDVELSRLATARLTRLRSELAHSPYDALLLTTPESVQYATGYRSVGADLYRTHRMAALVTPDDLWLVAPTADAAPAADEGVPLDRIIPFGRFFFESIDHSSLSLNAGEIPNFGMALQTAFRSAGGIRRCGVEDLGADVSLELDITAGDATGLVMRARSIKLPDEVKLLRYAAQLAESAVATAVADASDGITEKELARAVATTMVAGGASPRFIVAAAGHRSALADCFASDRPWRRGEVVRFDTGCLYNGYWSDIGRTVVMGEPTAVQATRYDALLAGQQAQFELARPGVAAKELFDAAVQTVNAQGLPYRRQHCGHGIGLSIYESPIVSPGVDEPLSEGMTLCLETPYYELGWGGMMVEDTVLVTAQGMERLTATDRGLWMVDS